MEACLLEVKDSFLLSVKANFCWYLKFGKFRRTFILNSLSLFSALREFKVSAKGFKNSACLGGLYIISAVIDMFLEKDRSENMISILFVRSSLEMPQIPIISIKNNKRFRHSKY